MITEDYVSFEIARLLRDKGFDYPCEFQYINCSSGHPFLTDRRDENGNYYRNSELGEDEYSAPTLQMAMKWLREIHKIFIYIEPFITTSGLQGYKPYCTKIGGEFMWINPLRKYSNTSSDTYEEATEAAIKYCLENLV